MALREAELLRKELERGLAQQQQQLRREQQEQWQQLLQQLQQQEQLEQQRPRPQSPAAATALAALSNPSSPRPSSSSPKWALGRAGAGAAASAHSGGGGGASGTRSLDEIEEQVKHLQQHLSSLPGLLQPLWSELQLGRWLWTSNMLKGTSKTAHGASAGCVPWNSERLNTCPEGLLWAHDRPFIQVHLSHSPRPRLGLRPTPSSSPTHPPHTRAAPRAGAQPRPLLHQLRRLLGQLPHARRRGQRRRRATAGGLVAPHHRRRQPDRRHVAARLPFAACRRLPSLHPFGVVRPGAGPFSGLLGAPQALDASGERECPLSSIPIIAK